MKLVLTSSGVTNTSIQNALVDLLGKPMRGSSALCIPTSSVGRPICGDPASVRRFIIDGPPRPCAVWAGSRSASSN